MESVSLLKVIKQLLDAEHVFNLLLSPSFSLFWWLNCNLCNSLLCRPLAFLNTEKFTTFLSFSSATFTGAYCSFYCRFWLQLGFSRFLRIPKGASLCLQEFWSDPMKTLSAIGSHIVRVATPAQRASLFLRRPAFSCSSWAITTHLSFAAGSPAPAGEGVSQPELPLQLKLSSSLLVLAAVMAPSSLPNNPVFWLWFDVACQTLSNNF